MQGLCILTVLAIYFGILLLVSRFTGGRGSNSDFFIGGRRASWPLVSLGMVGASISGVSLVSVPGMVRDSAFTYLQMCMGFFVGYLIIAKFLLPLYYKGGYLSIYRYLEERFGCRSYKSGALFFLLSKLTSAAARLYLVCMIIQILFLEALGIPFVVTVLFVVLLVWFYTRRSGIGTIIYTDLFQTLALLLALLLMLWQVAVALGGDPGAIFQSIGERGYSRLFLFDDFKSQQNFFKMFVSGIFITIVMTGLDQDTMQKNLSCRTLKEAQKNMCCYGMAFLPVNFMLLLLGAMLLLYANESGALIPEKGDALLTSFVASGELGLVVSACFAVGVVAAAFSSVDSAMTAITTTLCVDILGVERRKSDAGEKLRRYVHVAVALLFVLCVLLFELFNDTGLLDAIYTLVGYTYGPLLGMFTFGMFTKRKVRDVAVPYISILSPILSLLLSYLFDTLCGYKFGYELLMINGMLVFMGMWMFSESSRKMQ